MTDPLRPLAKTIVGYCEPLAVDPGGAVSIHVSSEIENHALSCEIVRLTGAGTPDHEPPFEVVVAVPGAAVSARRPVHPGSHVVVEAVPPAVPPTLLCLVRPTCAPGNRQALLSWGDPFTGDGLALVLDADLRPALIASDGANVTLDRPIPVDAWSVVVAGRSAAGEWTVRSAPLSEGDPVWNAVSGPAHAIPEGMPVAPLVIAAVRAADGGVHCAFTGLIEAPTVIEAPVDDVDPLGTLLREIPVPESAWASFDFAVGIGSWLVTDVGPHARSGVVRNVPVRGVPGATWSATTSDWREAPAEYAAIHFLADALEDCQWPADWTVRLPADAPSGFYAARVHGDFGTDLIPFFVRPGDERAPVLLIAPTATYLAYANSRFWWEDPIQELVQDRLVELGAEEQYLLAHPDLGLSNYDQHVDGSPVCFSSTRRPNLNMRPGHVRGEGYASDLHIVAWLEHLGERYDVVTDLDWHLRGRELVDGYSVVLTGTHPEYVSLRMLDSATEWVQSGGRFMYLGGNGFSMNITFDPERPWLMENRRVELWDGPQAAREARAHNAVDGERGGYFTASGRHPARLTGVESATMGFDRSYPYHLGEAARRPEVAFALEGITGNVIGSGVVGQEWDNAAGCPVGPGHVVLGSSRDHSLIPPLFGAMRPDYHADLVLDIHEAGAAFSVSSMAWAAELPVNGYRNDVARMTENVLRRFLDSRPFRERNIS
ncbi:MAG TPA: N,N-dimethylformamidase beta subunit family domain-containing protein [Mycobacteriales bacterium]|nr:N,N-dimethylformamidase beta subunit family domain-containing protein [Mycobacteriales bacterium]